MFVMDSPAGGRPPIAPQPFRLLCPRQRRCGLVARAPGHEAGLWAYWRFAAFQATAIVRGWRFRQKPLRPVSAITASILLVVSFGLRLDTAGLL
jgi:hypothetical protein